MPVQAVEIGQLRELVHAAETAGRHPRLTGTDKAPQIIRCHARHPHQLHRHHHGRARLVVQHDTGLGAAVALEIGLDLVPQRSQLALLARQQLHRLVLQIGPAIAQKMGQRLRHQHDTLALQEHQRETGLLQHGVGQLGLLRHLALQLLLLLLQLVQMLAQLVELVTALYRA